MPSDETQRFLDRLKEAHLDPEVEVVERRRADTWRTPVLDTSKPDHRHVPPDPEKQKSWRHDTKGFEKLTDADRARRRREVGKLWPDLTLTTAEIADMLGIGTEVVRQDAYALGFGERPNRQPLQGAKGRRVTARRAEVARLVQEEGLGTRAIAARLGVNSSTIQEDRKVLGISGRTGGQMITHAPPRVDTATKAITQMELMAGLILDQNLIGIELTPEQEEEWSKALTRVTKAVGYVRRSIKKGKL